MIRKILIFVLTLLTFNSIYSKEKVLLVGFSNKNFIAEAKPIDILAKKNSISEDKVIPLYKNSLLLNLFGSYNEFDFISASEKEISYFDNNVYTQLDNINGKPYLGIRDFNNPEEIKGLFKTYNTDYILHVSQYRMYVGVYATNLNSKLIHEIDYQIINKELKTVSAGKMKLVAGAVMYVLNYKPSGIKSKYKKVGRKISKRLYIDLANQQSFYYETNTDVLFASIAPQISYLKQEYKYDPKNGFGLIAGWGTPYGWGIEFSHAVKKKSISI